jgi:hypothetical protein
MSSLLTSSCNGTVALVIEMYHDGREMLFFCGYAGEEPTEHRRAWLLLNLEGQWVLPIDLAIDEAGSAHLTDG